MLLAAAGVALLGGEVSALADREVAVSETILDGVSGLVAEVRDHMTEPEDPQGRRRAVDARSVALRQALPIDAEGRAVNEWVRFIESEPAVVRVSQVCECTGLGERALQRLALKRVGLSPTWLIRRRRIRDAAEQVALGGVSLADLAASLGYADQAHCHRDFRAATGTTRVRARAPLKVSGPLAG